MKLCINCKFHTDDLRCQNPTLMDPVTGLPGNQSCNIVRAPGSACGPEGKLYEGMPQAEAPEAHFPNVHSKGH